jgi:hypothetical protein
MQHKQDALAAGAWLRIGHDGLAAAACLARGRRLVTGAHRNDVTQLLPLLDAIPAVHGTTGRPRQRPT